jgi:hypothetical protein
MVAVDTVQEARSARRLPLLTVDEAISALSVLILGGLLAATVASSRPAAAPAFNAGAAPALLVPRQWAELTFGLVCLHIASIHTATLRSG